MQKKRARARGRSGTLLGMLAAALAAGATATATPITEPNQIVPQTVIDFDSLAPGGYGSPIVISGVTFSGGDLHVIDTDGFGASTSFPNYVSDKALGRPQLSSQPPPYTITFSSPVAQVGFGLFDPNFAGNLIKAFDTAGNLLETTAPDALFPPGGSGADYLGFSRSSADIKRIEIIASFDTTTDALWVDNLAFSTAPIPEPGTFLLLGTGVAGLLARRRRS
jgi:hypothetical protein